MSKTISVYYAGEEIKKALEEFEIKTEHNGRISISTYGYTLEFEEYNGQTEMHDVCFVSTTTSRLLNRPANNARYSLNFSNVKNPYFDAQIEGEYKDKYQRRELLLLIIAFLTVTLYGDVDEDLFNSTIEDLGKLFYPAGYRKRKDDTVGSSAFSKLKDFLF